MSATGATTNSPTYASTAREMFVSSDLGESWESLDITNFGATWEVL